MKENTAMSVTNTVSRSATRREVRPPRASEAPAAPPEVRSEGAKPFQTVYTIVERERDGHKFWLKIGAAFQNRDGSLHVKLDAIPTNGQLHIRESKSAEDRQQDADREELER
jgi:hypothetical protein